MISPEEKQAVIDLFPFMGENPVVFDAGSNKGHWADIVLDEYKEGKCQLHLFEPNEKLISFTEIKYEYCKNIFFHHIGLFNEDVGVAWFNYFENFNNELSSLYPGGKEWDDLPVKRAKIKHRSIDSICRELYIQYIDYLKIDTEGADIDVLNGCKEWMTNDRVGIIQIEYSEHWARAKYNFSNLKDIADHYGYKIYRYIDGNFWEEKSESPEYDNYFLTKYEIHNYSVGGWNNHFLLSVCDLPKFDLMLEIGAFEGGTTKYMCENMLNEGGRVIVVDPLSDFYVKDDPRYHPEFKHQYQRFLRNTRGLPVELHRGKSEDELSKLNALRFDFCFVDGNHYPDWPYFDGCWAFAETKIGGYLLFDDWNIWADETKASIDKFLDEFKGHYQIIKEGYQVLIRKTSNRYNELTQSYYL